MVAAALESPVTPDELHDAYEAASADDQNPGLSLLLEEWYDHPESQTLRELINDPRMGKLLENAAAADNLSHDAQVAWEVLRYAQSATAVAALEGQGDLTGNLRLVSNEFLTPTPANGVDVFVADAEGNPSADHAVIH
ncbi:MAG: hypothetical protein MI747_08910, partial [Desulfobacterales bacterium]|nr:hypothetical protein [Desulfobacterales bacterium]